MGRASPASAVSGREMGSPTQKSKLPLLATASAMAFAWICRMPTSIRSPSPIPVAFSKIGISRARAFVWKGEVSMLSFSDVRPWVFM